MDAESERLRRWRLALGEQAKESCPAPLDGDDAGFDRALTALYESDRKAGLGSSSPNVAKWLGDIREYFPQSVVQVLQQDALERLDLKRMLTEPELLEAVVPDIHLLATIMSLRQALPARTKDTARKVVRKVVDALQARLREKTVQAARGALHRAARTRKPRVHEIDWPRTIRKNLHHWQPSRKAMIAERLVGFGHRRPALKEVVLCVDQSGSMATSVVYSGIFGSALASLRSLRTRMVCFDTEVVDLSDDLQDPVDLLFGVQLGGGTDISRALRYCQERIARPRDTVLVLVSDLFDSNPGLTAKLAGELLAAGVRLVCLLALDDSGQASFDPELAGRLAGLGAPAFACTPDLFPDLMAAALQGQDLTQWAARHRVSLARAN